MKLIINKEVAKKGMILTDFRGKKAKLISWKEPHKSSSCGFVYVRLLDENGNETERTGEYYVTVYGGKFVHEDAWLNRVPAEVEKTVKEHLDKMGYDLHAIHYKSSHPEDEHLFIVVGKKKSSNIYDFWTCWNQTTESLNHGHYGYDDPVKALEAAREYCVL